MAVRPWRAVRDVTVLALFAGGSGRKRAAGKAAATRGPSVTFAKKLGFGE